MSASGVSTNALISKVMFRDLLGNVVKEVDEARDPQSESLISSRTRRKQYDSVGQLTAEIDATNRRVEYAYSIHGERLGTRNARGTVFFDRHDRNGNVRFHGVLRTSSPAGVGEYNSHAGTGTIVRTYLNAYLYDQAEPPLCQQDLHRRCRRAVVLHMAGWAQLRQSSSATRWELSPDAATTSSATRPSRSTAPARARNGMPSTADYAVGRIDTYRQPTDSGMKFGRYTYNDFGELRSNALGNTGTEYDRHKNGLVHQVNDHAGRHQAQRPGDHDVPVRRERAG